jgi:peptidoglycan/xylan/chitin deacetylase (PgdA/CDA1 family)
MKYLTLTFDNGPTSGTPFVLDVLAERGILSTFFLVGKQLREDGGRALAARAKAAGHWIGNHTLSHDIPLGHPGAPPDHHLAEIGGMAELLGDLQQDVPLYRPYAGKGILGPHVFTRQALDHVRGMGHSVVLWNSVPRDWELPASGWVGRALADIERQDWTVMVLHDKPNAAMAELPRFLDEVRARGVQLRQDFPDDCVPVLAGEARRDLSALTRRD